MTKRQLIDEIVSLNSTAQPAFLARFEDLDLNEYLQHLRNARTPRLSGDPHRYDKYFNNGRRDASYPPANYGMDSSITTDADSDERAALLGKPAQAELQTQAQLQMQAELPIGENEAELDANEVEGHVVAAEPQDQAEMDEIPTAVATALDEFDDEILFHAHDDVDQIDEFVPADAQDEDDAEAADETENETTVQDEIKSETLEVEPAAEPSPVAEAPIEAPIAEAPVQDASPAAEAAQPSAPKPFAEAQEDSQSWLF